MKTRRFLRKAALAAAICLSLTQSVWAMPRDGTVAKGKVTLGGSEYSEGNVIQGFIDQNIVVNGTTIINWIDFGIEAGHSLTVDTTNGALLNCVNQNGNISKIYGTLTQHGGNPMFLVNPNGILVGNGATINAQNLVLSTLALNKFDFEDGNYHFTNPNGSSPPAKLEIQSGAKFTNSASAAAAALGLFGGTVEVADGVTFSGIRTIQAAATNNVQWTGGNYLDSSTATPDNELKFSGVTINGSGIDDNSFVDLRGGKVNLGNTSISGVYDLEAKAYNSQTALSGDQQNQFFATADNTITANNLTVNDTASAQFMGGNVDMKNSSINITNNTTGNGKYTRIWAGESWIDGNESQDAVSLGDASHAVNLTNSKIASNTNLPDKSIGISVIGGKVTLDNTQVQLDAVKDSEVQIFAFKQQNDNGALVSEAGNDILVTNGSNVVSSDHVVMFGNTLSVTDNSEINAGGDSGFIAGNEIQYPLNGDGGPKLVGAPNEITISKDSRIIVKGVDISDLLDPTRSSSDGSDGGPSTDGLDKPTLQNLKLGYAEMNNIFAEATSPEALVIATRDLVQRINDGPTDSRAQAAQVSGVLFAIFRNNALSETEKVALQREVAQSFYPTQVAITTANNQQGV